MSRVGNANYPQAISKGRHASVTARDNYGLGGFRREQRPRADHIETDVRAPQRSAQAQEQ
jgi:hypothetical protein